MIGRKKMFCVIGELCLKFLVFFDRLSRPTLKANQKSKVKRFCKCSRKYDGVFL